MSLSHALALSALLLLGAANAAAEHHEASTKPSDLVGEWTGQNKLWVMPGDPVRESESTASVSVDALGTLAIISYTWAYEGTPQEGALMFPTDGDKDDLDLIMHDTWHTGRKFMAFSNEEPRDDSLVHVHGTYGAGSGPDWGWRILVHADGSDAFGITMYNITPDGQEVLAVDAQYTRP